MFRRMHAGARVLGLGTQWLGHSHSPRITRPLGPINRPRCRRAFDRTWAKPLTNKGDFVNPIKETLTPTQFVAGESEPSPVPRQSLRGDICRLILHRHMPRLGGSAVEPGAD